MRTVIKFGFVLAAAAAFMVGVVSISQLVSKEPAAIADVVTVPVLAPRVDGQVDNDKLGRHILADMEIVKSPLSPLERQVLAQFLVGVANNTFERYQDKENWIIVLGNESKFNQGARSPTGAVGIGQLIPSFAKDFAASCGIKNFQPNDVENLMVNATLSACFFRDLLEVVPEHSVTLALGAYNSGLYSGTIKSLQNLHNINLETANYIARFTYVKEALVEKPADKKKHK